ncbi:hypothetical protein IV203_038205 [Nitzschia inconspicua]|uniref:Uncharacterized protein n=1 Tax=Nitzschia inconspicua TaxID=303405 RepID=A0A9K3LMU2_9STRA|nr:hypothetical protein IV203_038205 [Nitzschia inconspicua]
MWSSVPISSASSSLSSSAHRMKYGRIGAGTSQKSTVRPIITITLSAPNTDAAPGPQMDGIGCLFPKVLSSLSLQTGLPIAENIISGHNKDMP